MADWIAALLKAGNWPDTPQNRSFLSTWQGKEGGSLGGAHGWNPFNVTGVPGYPTFPETKGPPVCIFPDIPTMARETVRRIFSGYSGINEALWSGNPATYQKNASTGQPCILQMNFRAWVNGPNDLKTAVYGGWNGGNDYSCKGGAPPPASTIVPPAPPPDGAYLPGDAFFGPLNTVESWWDSLTDWLSVLKYFISFIVWLLSPKHWVQMLEVLVGSVLVGIGLYQLAKSAQGASGGSARQSAKQAVAPVRRVVTRAAA
jgi:hypothetical protein